jgi:hypothetical protein
MVKIRSEFSPGLGLFLLIVGAGLVWYLFPTDSRQIRSQLKTMASQISFVKQEHPIETIKRARIVGKYVAKRLQVTVKHSGGFEEKDLSNTDVQQHILAASKHIAPSEVTLRDFSITVKGRKANANFTAIIDRLSKEYGSTAILESYAQELETEWTKEGSDWKLTQINNVEVIE